jgi:hypothetical protein
MTEGALPVIPGGDDIKQMMKTGQLYLIKNSGIVRRTYIIIEETFDYHDQFDQEELDSLEYSWLSDLQGIPEC